MERNNEKKIVFSEVENRLVVNLDKSITRTNEGVNGLLTFGQNNDYPNLIEKLILGSPDAKIISNVVSKFICGQGFENEAINEIVVGTDPRGKKITLHTLLRQISASIAYFSGFYIHCNYNVNSKAEFKISSVFIHPFKNCRFAKADDTGFSAKICVFDNWQKAQNVKYDKSLIKSYPVFNSKKEVLTAQIKKGKFKGQVYFEFFDNQFAYPLSPFDSVYSDMDTQAQISLHKNRETRNGFLKKTIVRLATEGETEDERMAVIRNFKKLLGVNGDNLVILDTEVNPDTGEIAQNGAFAVDTIDSSVNPELFNSIEQSLRSNIRKAGGFGMPEILIDFESGKLGTTSGEAIIQGVAVMNALVLDIQNQISKSFKEIFSNFENEILANNENWKIKPLKLI